MKKVTTSCGSQSKTSENLSFIHEMKRMAGNKFDIEVFQKLSPLPHFNPDLDNEAAPEAVINFMNIIRDANGVLICTPEYAMGVPGTLKNALAWVVISMELSSKPVALVTASTLGEKAHHSLLGTLKVLEADVDDRTTLLISYIKSKMDAERQLKQIDTRQYLEMLIDSLAQKISESSLYH